MRQLTPTLYIKRAAGRVAATPALQNKPVGLASCTTQPDARRPLEYPHLAVASAYGTRARTPFAPRTSSDTSRADLKSFTEADYHVSSNQHVHRTPATDSRRSADPTSEWVKPNGESPKCDSYDACLTEMLDTLTRRGSNGPIVPPHRALEPAVTGS